ncbi:MAG: hypothetical protein AVDCRST_MAG71-2173 [uncultured Lysobacter sp.]|uniref:Uncharacterized protein n=1 Tax=uncultured Lysobacter sp. TaxID=271060 RepID=A0A6J4LS76_9GAMM|nr:MAG: hypothetical protein AVDCRST_MAG71-2173 [uncultured Lysobacter sp.]
MALAGPCIAVRARTIALEGPLIAVEGPSIAVHARPIALQVPCAALSGPGMAHRTAGLEHAVPTVLPRRAQCRCIRCPHARRSSDGWSLKPSREGRSDALSRSDKTLQSVGCTKAALLAQRYSRARPHCT